MSTFQIGTTQAGLVNLATITGIPPSMTFFQEYAEKVGNDLNGAPIEAGLPRARWEWEYLPQARFDALCGFCSGMSATVYIQTRQNVGSGFTWTIYRAIMARPTADIDAVGAFRKNVQVEFVMLESV